MNEVYKNLLIQKDKKIQEYEKEIIQLKKELKYYKTLSYFDTLTNLYNRRILSETDDFDNIILGDIDYFKVINDTYGHDIGDEVLVEISNFLKSIVNSDDIVCRWGGEEFLILLKNCTQDEAFNKANQIKQSLIILKSRFGFNVTMSFGVSSIHDNNIEYAIKNADKAMYESKEKGRNKITVYSLKK